MSRLHTELSNFYMVSRSVCFLLPFFFLVFFNLPAFSETDKARVDLLEPFGARQGSLFYSALGVPRMEAAWLVDPGRLLIRVSTDHSHSQKGRIIGGDTLQRIVDAGLVPENGFLGQFHTWLAIEAEYRLSTFLQAGARIGFGGWDEQQDHFYFTDERGLPVVSYEERDFYGLGATKRQDDFHDAFVKLKASILGNEKKESGSKLSGILFAKFPIGKPRNLVDAGTTDIGAGLIFSFLRDYWAFHAQLAGVLPVGEQNLFSPWINAEIDPFPVFSVGIVRVLTESWSFGVQSQIAGQAFGDVAFLDGDPFMIQAGFRRSFDRGTLDFGCGFGMDDESADWQLFAGWIFGDQ